MAKTESVDCSDREGWTALHKAAANGKADILRSLLAQGSNVNAQTKNGRTPLYLAAVDGNEECVMLLLANDADPGIKNEEGRAAGEVAKLFNHHAVLELIRGERKVPEHCRLAKVEAAERERDVRETRKHGSDEIRRQGVAEEIRDWKKTDFSKWSRLKESDWEAIEERVGSTFDMVPAAVSRTPSQSSRRQQHAERGHGKVGPPKVLPPHHPRYSEYERYMEYKRELEESFRRQGREDGRLLSLKPPPEGGSEPNERNGSHGPGYTWGQTLGELHVSIVLPRGSVKEDVKCDLQPNAITVKVRGKKRWDSIFNQSRLWKKIKVEGSFWTVEENRLLSIHLEKLESTWWRCVTDGDGHVKIDSTLCKAPDLLCEYNEKQQEEWRSFFSQNLSKHLPRP